MPSPDTTLTNSDARGTGNKGLSTDAYPPETIQYIYDEKGNITGVFCKYFQELSADIASLDKPATKDLYKDELEMQWRRLFAGLISYRTTGTSCLLKAAGSLHQLLGLVIALPDVRMASSIVNGLLDIYQEIERRTREPYQYQITMNDKDLYRPLPKKILNEYPLNQNALWKQVKQKKMEAECSAAGKKKAIYGRRFDTSESKGTETGRRSRNGKGHRYRRGKYQDQW